MSEKTPMYAYVDLAESTGVHNVMRVPGSGGVAREVTSDLVQRVIHSKDGECVRGEGVTLVAGQRAIEVAEREVLDAAQSKVRFPSLTGSRVCCVSREDEFLLVNVSGSPTHWVAAMFPHLSRAVELRDMLCEKLKLHIDSNNSTRTMTEAHDRAKCTPPAYATWGTRAGANPRKAIYPARTVIAVNFDVENAVSGMNRFGDALRAASINLTPTKEPPMPTVKPKPDPHAKCALYFEDGKLVDDYGRCVYGVQGITVRSSLEYAYPMLQVDFVSPVKPRPKDGIRPPVVQSAPLVIDIVNVSPADAAFIARELSEKTHQAVIALNSRVHFAEPQASVMPLYVPAPTVDYAAEISRRAELSRTIRRVARVAFASGVACVLALIVGAGLIAPQWVSAVAAWLGR